MEEVAGWEPVAMEEAAGWGRDAPVDFLRPRSGRVKFWVSPNFEVGLGGQLAVIKGAITWLPIEPFYFFSLARSQSFRPPH